MSVPLDEPSAARTRARTLLLGAFLVSGAAGLAYELVWSRYLALLLGHSAYAQVVVIAVYLGGMALGAAVVGQRSSALPRPLTWYVRAELVLGAMGLLFHPVYRVVAGAARDVLLPGASEVVAGILPWLLSVLLLLPPAVLLGATFPLMAAALLRRFDGGAGRTVADAYLWNALGGALGVLVAGFLLVPFLGTAGALAVLAGGNFAAAGVAAFAGRRSEPHVAPAAPRAPAPADSVAGAGAPVAAQHDRALPVILGVAFFSAVASLLLGVGWIRMLSLVMGSASHAFELMVSAFVLGLAVGAWMIREPVDRTPSPVRLLGSVEWLMGVAALATLPVYAASFDMMAGLVSNLPRDGSGYVAFNVARYGIGLLVTLPATVLAGATLPLLTAILLGRGAGERAVGWVYGADIVGVVVGVVAAGLILLPLVGLEGIFLVGACLHLTLGVALLAWSRRAGEDTPRTLAPGGAVLAAGIALAVAGLVHLDRATLTGGAFGYGGAPDEEEREVVFYDDGRTATVAVHVIEPRGVVVLTTNGTPDASLPVRWIRSAAGDTVEPSPLRARDASTETVSALTLLAHRPDARRGLNVGHGSGMSAAALLTSERLDGLRTVEIEPAVVRGSRTFLPANARTFTDSRHTFVLDDVRAHLARTEERFDLILSEPSDAWVSGAATLFTEEFYRRVRERLAPNGVFGQRIPLYGIDDGLLVTVLQALHRVFPDYRAYLVGGDDLLVVGGAAVSEPDWSVFRTPPARADLAHLPPFGPGWLEALEVFRREDLDPLLGGDSIPANRDFRPRLESGAERARYERRAAAGTRGLAIDRFDILASLAGRRRPPARTYEVPPVWSLEPMGQRAAAAWVGEIQRGERELTMPPVDEWQRSYLDYLVLIERMDQRIVPSDWAGWVEHFVGVEALLHAGTAGWADEEFYADVRTFLDAVDAPEIARAAVDFSHGLAAWRWAEAAGAADRIRAFRGPLGHPVPAGLLMDGGVVAYLKEGREEDAAELLRELGPRTGRSERDLRTRLLRAHIGRRDADFESFQSF